MFKKIAIRLLPCVIIAGILLANCQRQRESQPLVSAEGQPASAAPNDLISAKADAAPAPEMYSSSAAVAGKIDSLRKFVRTANLQFRVKNVLQTTLQTERIAQQHGGFVITSNLGTDIEQRLVDAVSRDSAVETTRFKMTSRIVLRVPYRQLDTTLRSIGRMAEFLDHRNISAEDVGLQLLEQELALLRQRSYQTQIETTVQPNEKYDAAGRAADRLLQSRSAADASRLETLKIEDQVLFSTITLYIYQSIEVHQTMVANTDIKPVRRSLGGQLAEAFNNGRRLLEILFLGIVNLWSIFLVVGLGWLAIRGVRKQQKNK